MNRAIVRFIKGNGYYVKGDVTQLDVLTAKELHAKNMVEILDAEAPVMEANITPEIKSTLPEPPNSFICPICGKEFKTEQALKAHKAKAHKVQ